MGESEEMVMSEVHLGCPPNASTCVSVFSIRHPDPSISGVIVEGFSRSGKAALDEDGDLVVSRRKRLKTDHEGEVIFIRHRLKTSIRDVGFQIWRGSLLLSDYLLDRMYKTNELDNVVALELGSGSGIVGIMLARKAKSVFITDYHADILHNCNENVAFNTKKIDNLDKKIKIRKLDWFEPWPPVVYLSENSIECQQNHYAWSKADFEELEGASIILAADLIYNDELTDAFFGILRKLMPFGSHKVLYIALEKRYNFSLDDLDVVANGYTHFREFFDLMSKGTIESRNLKTPFFIGEQIDMTNVPQYIQPYERTCDLELWKLWRR